MNRRVGFFNRFLTVATAALSPRSRIDVAPQQTRAKRLRRSNNGEWCRFEGCDVKARQGTSLCELHTNLADSLNVTRHDDEAS